MKFLVLCSILLLAGCGQGSVELQADNCRLSAYGSYYAVSIDQKYDKEKGELECKITVKSL